MDWAKLGIRVDTSDLDRANRKVREFGDQTERQGKRIGGAAGVASKGLRVMAVAATAAVAALGGIAGAARVIADFDRQMGRVAAISRATASELADMRDIAKELGSTTEFTAAQAAEGLQFLAMAGFSAGDSMKALPSVLNLATAASMDLGRTADITSNIMSAFRIEAGRTAEVTDALTAISTRANTSVEQLGEAMKMVGPIASATGIELNKTAAALGVLADSGLQATLGGTGLRKMLSVLLDPTKQEREALESLGVSMDDLNPKTNDLVDILQTLADAGFDVEDAFAAFGDRGGPAVQVLIQSIPRLRQLNKEMEDIAGATDEAAGIIRNDLQGAFDSLKSATQGLGIALGEAGLTAVLTAVVDALTFVARATTEVVEAVTNGVTTIYDFARQIAAGRTEAEIFAEANADAASALSDNADALDNYNAALGRSGPISQEALRVRLAELETRREELLAIQKATLARQGESEELKRLRDNVESARETMVKLESINSASAEGFRQRYVLAINALDEYITKMRENNGLTKEQKEEFDKINAAIALVGPALEKANGPLVDLKNNAADSAEEFERLAEAKRKLEADRALEMLDRGTQMNLYSAGRIAGEAARREDPNYGKPPVTTGGGGGGRSASDTAERERLRNERERLRNERERARLMAQAGDATELYALRMRELNEQKERLNLSDQVYLELADQIYERTFELSEAQQFFNEVGAEFEQGLTRSIIAGEGLAGVMVNLGNAIAEAALQAALFGSGPLAEFFGLSGTGIFGGSGGGSGLTSFISGLFTGGFADGTDYAPGGIALVGERGPELVNLPRGASVTTAERTREILSGGMAAPNVTVAPPQVNTEIVNVFDPSIVGRWAETPSGKKTILNVVRMGSA